jgi:hypothetical protein
MRQLQRKLKSWTPHEFQQCFPYPLFPRKDKVYQKLLPRIILGKSYTSEVDFDDDIDDFLTPADIS